MSIPQIIILSITMLLVTGTPALINMFINPSRNNPYPKQIALTPIAMFLTILGVTGMSLVAVSPTNFRNGNRKLAERQFWVGISMLFSTYLALEILFWYSFS